MEGCQLETCIGLDSRRGVAYHRLHLRIELHVRELEAFWINCEREEAD